MGDFAPTVRDGANYQSLNTYLSDFFSDDDYLFANLETPLTTHEERRENKRYCFRTNPKFIDQIPRNFIFSIANNHIMDYGAEGLFETIETLESKSFKFAGAGRNIEEAGKPAIIEHNEHQIGFLASADQRYQAATETRPGVLPAVPEFLIPRINELRSTVDLVIVSIHMGMEYISLPTPSMKNLSSVCHDAGADIVFFHHAHCVSGYTLQYNKMTLWGTGNFVFPRDKDFPYKDWFDVAVWQISFNFSTRQLDLHVTPLNMDLNGIPLKAEKTKEEHILSRIEYYSSLINREKNLKWHILRHVLRVSYLQVFFSNYIDMIYRSGIKNVISQMRSSVNELFRKKS